MAGINVFKKKQAAGTIDQDWKDTGSFVRKPSHGWLYPDHLMQSGVTYELKYVGAVKILESMRKIPFENRGKIVREAIALCCHTAGVIPLKKRKASNTLSEPFIGDWCGPNSVEQISASISTAAIVGHSMKDGSKVLEHVMETISFSSMGEGDYKSMVGYVAKDANVQRACFVLECGALADDIIHTIGQAFELKYKEFLKAPVKAQIIPERSKSKVEGTNSPIPARFTDPVFETSDASTNEYAPLNNNMVQSEGAVNPSEYSHLKHGPKNDKRPTLDGYDRLMGYQPSVSDPDATGFLPGPTYGGIKEGAGVVYDNPIASPLARRLIHGPGSEENPYDNPLTIAEELDSMGASRAVRPFELDLSSKPGTEHDAQGYLVPTPTSPRDTPDFVTDSVFSAQNSKLSRTVSRDVDREVWFHGVLSRVEAEKLIDNDGDFLVRESSSAQGQFVLTGMKNGQHRHLLLVDPEGKVRTRDHTFDTVADLVEFHRSNNYPIHSGGSDVFLVQEVVRPDMKKRESVSSVRI